MASIGAGGGMKDGKDSDTCAEPNCVRYHGHAGPHKDHVGRTWLQRTEAPAWLKCACGLVVFCGAALTLTLIAALCFRLFRFIVGMP